MSSGQRFIVSFHPQSLYFLPVSQGSDCCCRYRLQSSDAEMTPARQSIVFFCNPNWKTNISCLPRCVGTMGPKYPAVTTEDYIVSRLSETYG